MEKNVRGGAMEKVYKPLTIPNLVWDKKTLTQTYGELVVQPLEPGFGITLGNALRRVLLGGVEGAAITSFICKGINNEFSVIPGIVEDAMQLSLNIKGIVVHSKDGRPGNMRVYKKGAGKVTVSDIDADNNLELINKDMIIAHVANDGECDIQFFVQPGRGYQVAQWPLDQAYQEDGRIYLDAMFCPISKVMFDVEKTRVGEAIDFDRLILKIYTNGAMNPCDALHYSVSVLRTQLEYFLTTAEIPFNSISATAQPAVEEESVVVSDAFDSEDELPVETKNIPYALLLKQIDELDLSARAANCLKSNGIHRVIDLVNLTEDELIKIKNFGQKSLDEVKAKVKLSGLFFGMKMKEEEIQKMITSPDESQ